MGMATKPALKLARLNVTINSSNPSKTNKIPFKISSINSQNMSTCSVVLSDIASVRPWLPISNPAATAAIGAETCNASAAA